MLVKANKKTAIYFSLQLKLEAMHFHRFQPVD